jgi:hypothetical protein
MSEGEKLHRQFLREIERLLRHSRPGGDLEPAASIEDWEKIIAAAPESSRELLRELACFADLWRFLSDRDEDLGASVVADISALHKLPPAERIARVQQINHKLMARVKNAGRGSQLRQ